jgi:dimethylargininase
LFQTAIVRKPGRNFAKGLTSLVGQPPDYEKVVQQHEAYCAALERCGLNVVRLEEDLAHPDSTFVEDVAVVTRQFAIITRPGAESRVGEVDRIREPLRRFFSAIDQIMPPGTLDGGDVCQAGTHFFIGVSRRTNEEGARQLGAFLGRGGYTSGLINIRRMKGVLHLKSGVAWLGDGQLAVAQELEGVDDFHGYELIRVPADEAYAANCVRVNDYVMIAAGFPQIATVLGERGFSVLPLDISEFRKMDGGLSCLSLRF